MPTFFAISLELCQQILTQAFDDATLQDLHVNYFVYSADILWRNDHLDNDPVSRTIYNPNIYNLATTLCEVDPQLDLDMTYVLKQVLPKLEFVLWKHEDFATEVDCKRHDLAAEREDHRGVEYGEIEWDGPQ
ncbi:hypothetical protein E2P81_ATG04039 [Venturia nashicola]|uniref:Uncharacterized protein n=1 Tax=Venturia nashicola TaxID=86259 RepID=A0A4Z1PQM4_9PEZI|nr:hypothetical protein E6O75_ATG04139 [Venturia nashicola]TLD37227.1 hypothetical protein E2P81_ATG04039 [Venturia nashicola]